MYRHPQAHFLNTRTQEILKHWAPDIYERVSSAQPPVERWKSFRFGRSVSDAEPLAEVVHPVDRPLQTERDANGVLREDAADASAGAPLSPCAVGHLAQHTFSRILYEAAVDRAANVGSQLLFESPVRTVRTVGDGLLEVACEDGKAFSCSVCVAADGARSAVRQAARMTRSGREAMQHLINVHVALPTDEQTAALHRHNNHAMLYSVYNEQVVAMVVCHSIGEYVVQIPYFPPHQTLEEDFGPDRLHVILQAIFGAAVDTWVVQSVSSWTMSSLVADEYVTDEGVALTGDAAHVFPPAGGFGMNTGLQDAHNLAWKLAWAWHSGSSGDPAARAALLRSYETERRPVAQRNAALSVRNYRRLLQVTKSCYLNDNHPAVLQKMLQHSPLPLSVQRKVFRSLLQTALLPLSWLHQPESLYAKHIRSNLRKILKTGAGLPLLFPKYEIGFGYDSSDFEDQDGSSSDWKGDTWADAPVLRVGRLLPHVEVKVASGASRYPRLQFLGNGSISTRDLPAQMTRVHCPTFVLLLVGRDYGCFREQDFCSAFSKTLLLPVELAFITNGRMTTPATKTGLVLQETSQKQPFSFLSAEATPFAVLVRPDGHVAGVTRDLEDLHLLEQWTSGLDFLRRRSEEG
jgi:2-polyprenyl-6-methoxyphenol hydroxylase-like FAD-dependent oxidoreductase